VRSPFAGRVTARTGAVGQLVQPGNGVAPLTVANLQYSGIVFSGIYSVLVFGDRIDGAGWAGMALIVASGIAATVLRQRSLPKAPAEEH